MDNRTIEEVRNNETKLIKEIETLEEENQKLKKQLEEMDSKLFFTKNELEMRQKSIDDKLNQQKEFIEWLEKEIQRQEDYAVSLGLTIDYDIAEYTSGKIDALKESLSKYKEIIGDEKEDELNG